MAKITTEYDAKKAVDQAEKNLAAAKGRGWKGKDLDGYNKALKDAKYILKEIQKTLKASKKG